MVQAGGGEVNPETKEGEGQPLRLNLIPENPGNHLIVLFCNFSS